MAKKYGFLVNIERCVGCHSCEMACKNMNQLDPDIRWRKVYEIEETAYSNVPVRIYASLACNHCEDPACLKACPTGAYTKRADGIVVHDHDKCIGCKMCVMACPYDVPQYNPNYKKVEKCHMCHERIDQGLDPACVAGCPMDAIELIDMNQITEFGLDKECVGFPDTSITKPNVRFIKPRSLVQVRRDV